MSALEAIDDKVREFIVGDLDENAIVTGWVLMIASSRLDGDGDASYGCRYATGPGTDVVRAVGLVELARRQMLADCGAYGRDDDD